jgi:hypothetical protein
MAGDALIHTHYYGGIDAVPCNQFPMARAAGGLTARGMYGVIEQDFALLFPGMNPLRCLVLAEKRRQLFLVHVVARFAVARGRKTGQILSGGHGMALSAGEALTGDVYAVGERAERAAAEVLAENTAPDRCQNRKRGQRADSKGTGCKGAARITPGALPRTAPCAAGTTCRHQNRILTPTSTTWVVSSSSFSTV